MISPRSLVISPGKRLIDLPLRAFNEGLPRRVARAQKTISLHPFLYFCEQGGHLATPAPSLSAWLIRPRIHDDRHVQLIRHDDRLGAGILIQFIFEILRRECFRDHLLRLRLTLGADT